MDTCFAPAEKASEKELAFEIDFLSRNPIVSGLLYAIGGLLAILNEQRQVVALNDSFLNMLGIDDPEQALGLRPGEVLQCIHAYDKPAGCGTTKYCSTCGAAIAIVSSLGKDKPVERICALSINRDGKIIDMALLVRSHPIKIDTKKFLLIFLQDITQQQQRAALERIFFHDVNNILTMLVWASELLANEDCQSDLVETIQHASLRLKKEVSIQSYLSQSESNTYQPLYHEISAGEILEELRSFFANHPVAHKKNFEISKEYSAHLIKTDTSLVLRVLCNMITNALEATEENGKVKLWLEHEDNSISFSVWNGMEIPREVALRVFQRNFSTKEEAGRGLGTFSMKLLGEKILGGQVSFTTSLKEGTVFKFTLPL